MRARKRSRSTDVELNITAFLNLMVVLIPFLLLNAVFAQVSVLQLNLPSAEEAPPPEDDEDKPPFVLEVLVYKNRYEVVDRLTGPLKIIPNTEEGHDTEALHEFLKLLKKKTVDIGKPVTSATILCEDDTPYETLIKTMDAVRVTHEIINGLKLKKDLFPDVGIGSAPPDLTAPAGSSTEGGAA